MENILTELKDSILPQLNDIPNINRGGCGISAYAIANWIKKQDVRYEPKYIVQNGDFSNNRECIAKNRPLGDIPHILVEWENFTIDSNGAQKDWFPRLSLPISEDILIITINFGRWNSDFNRDHVETISEIVGINLNEQFRLHMEQSECLIEP